LTEIQPQYKVKEPNPTGIPAHWLRVLYRMAGLKRGWIYNITLVVPEQDQADPVFAVTGQGKIENQP
jgi:hypothetical protein